MIHECSYCNYQSTYKGNLKTHVKNKYSEKIFIEKDMKIEKPMKNDHHKQLKKNRNDDEKEFPNWCRN